MSSSEVLSFVMTLFVVLEDYYFTAFTLMISLSLALGVKRIFLKGNN